MISTYTEKMMKIQKKAEKNFKVMKNFLNHEIIKKQKPPFLWEFPSDKIKQISRKKFKEHELNCALRSSEKFFGFYQPLKFLEAKPVLYKDNSNKVKYKVKYFLVNMHNKLEIDQKTRKSTKDKKVLRPTYITPYTSELKWVTLKESKHLLSKGNIEIIQKALITIEAKLIKGFQYKNIKQLYKVIENYDNKNKKTSFNIINYIDK